MRNNSLEEWLSRIHPADRDRLESEILVHLKGDSPDFISEYRMLHKSGEYHWMLNRGLAVRDKDGVVYRMAGSLSDITIRKAAEERIIHDALYDALTVLPNRVLFMDRLDHALERVRRYPGYQFAVVFLDLDRFKLVNDSLGHSIGDEVICAVARLLQNNVRSADTVARLGGDEFVILVEDIPSVTEALTLANRLLEEMKQPIQIGIYQLFVTCSMGIVASHPDYESPEEMLRDADVAMYQAKMQGKSCYREFDAGMRHHAISRLEMETDLHRALKRGEFVLHYQPLIDLEGGQLVGLEALLRWQHPVKGFIPPADFIPVAEEMGIILPIGRWVLREVCRQLKNWQEHFQLGPDFTISINMSARHFTQLHLVDEVSQVLAEYNIHARQIGLEITESALISDIALAEDHVLQLHLIGVRIQLDDFGTGYSSLSYLHQLPIDVLKIDRSFINQVGLEGEGDCNGSEIVRTIISLARELHIQVVAEGIETDAQLLCLRQLGCQFGQGFLFSPALSVEQVETQYLKGMHNQCEKGGRKNEICAIS